MSEGEDGERVGEINELCLLKSSNKLIVLED